jgi:hypothetical protein
MESVLLKSSSELGYDFIPEQYLPDKKDEYYLRNSQLSKKPEQFRNLKSYEIEELVKNGNTSDNWDNILVTDNFDPKQIKNNDFFGFIRIGEVRKIILEHHDLQVPVGITNSRIISCDIGHDVAIHNVRYLAHYIIGNRCILLNIDEMHTTNHAKFGNGILKEGESEKVRVWVDLINETGSRKIIPFNGIITADAYIWAKYRDDDVLQKRLKEITQNTFSSSRGYYGRIEDQCVIKNSRILKDIKIGSHCYIKGANKLKNLTINSSGEEPTQIGEGVEIVNGIIGYGCHIFYGIKAVRFIMGNNSNLKYGARLINSFLGDNSTISCCEVLNNLIFPAHEQHHNNSFLIASAVFGQSNIAAGATIGSNHNSRANDNEIQAGRGFWPGLCTTVKHSCKFASFTLIAKGDYPAELNIPLPFSLVNNNVSKDRLEIMPAFWWMYNMYALARNTWKFQTRDKRKTKIQNIEFDSLAPDSIEEIFNARKLLEIWTAKAELLKRSISPSEKTEKELIDIGKKLLTGEKLDLEVFGENIEKSKRRIKILNVLKGYKSYTEMLHYYAVKNIIEFFKRNPDADFSGMCKELAGVREKTWVNIGGQLVLEKDLDKLRNDIGSGKLNSWEDIHNRYNDLWKGYKLSKQKHAFAVLLEIFNTEKLTIGQFKSALDEAVRIQEYICSQVYLSRKKDFENPFRRATYRNMNEMEAAIGTIDDNSFVKQVKLDAQIFKKMIEKIKNKLK